MAALEKRHRPRELTEVQDLDAVGQREQLRQKDVSSLRPQRRDRRGQFLGDIGSGPGAAEPEQPKPGCRKRGGDSTQVAGAVTSKDISKEMVVDDNRGHYVVARSGSSRLRTNAR